MRIIHFSDIHLGAWTRDLSAIFDKRLLGQLNYLLRRKRRLHEEYIRRAVEKIPAMHPDIVVCSGDITCVGSPEEFRKAIGLLRPFVDHEEFDFLYVPGNHDAYVRKKECRASLEQAFHALNKRRWRIGDLPVVLTYGDVQVFLLNECSPTSIVSSAGRLSDASKQALAAHLSKPRTANAVRILVGHFPPC
ncbi:MAG: metallophosphoesterase, partial [Candidatus Pacebacteria bacterium]|nr:metallophosphoesterase [Candidatus Paceibacterota bacterium]